MKLPVEDVREFIDLLLKTHVRKLTYLYTGFSNKYNDYYTIGSTNDDDLKYNNPGQSIGVFDIHKDHSTIDHILVDLLKVNISNKWIVNLKHIGTYLTRLKFNLEEIKVDKDDYGLYFLNQDKKVYYATEMDDHFSILRFQSIIDYLINNYHNKNKIKFILDPKEIKEKRKLKYNLNKIDLPDLKNRSVILQEGNDIPNYKNCDPYLCFIRYGDDKNFHYSFAGSLDHEDISIFIQRINVILV